MAEPSNGPASFWTQANALLRKNFTFQKRNIKTNIQLISFPFVLCLLIVLIQSLVNHELNNADNKCGCECIDTNGDGQCEKVCGIQFSTIDQVGTCPILNPPEWPPLLQIPAPQYRAVKTDFIPFNNDLPNDSCRRIGSCPATILFTGSNQSLGEILLGNMVPNSSTLNFSDVLGSLAQNVLGTASWPNLYNYLEPAFSSDQPVYAVEQQCIGNSSFSVAIQESSITFQQGSEDWTLNRWWA